MSRKSGWRPVLPRAFVAWALLGGGCGAELARDRVPPSAAVPPAGLGPRALVATRDSHCVLERGEIRCWEAGDLQPWVEVVLCADCGQPRHLVGDSTSHQMCALTEAGGLWCRKDDTPAMSGIRDLATNDAFACALQVDRLVCWRPPRSDRILGVSQRPHVQGFARAHRADPGIVTLDALPVADLRDFVVTATAVCILDAAGGLTCHEFPDDPRQTRLGAAHTLVGVGSLVAVAAGADTCVLERGGRVVCWPAAEPLPGEITAERAAAGIDDARLLAAGPHDNCAVLTSGAVECWPAIRPAGPRPCPGVTALPGSPAHSEDVAELTVSACEVCVRSSEGAVRCWGATNVDPATGAGIPRVIPLDAR